MWSRILALIWKELLAILKDNKSRIAILTPPILQLFVFAFAATLDVKNVTIGILNLDNGEQAFELVQRFQGSPIFSKIFYLKKVQDIETFINNQKGVMVVFIEDQFSRNIDAGRKADVQLILDGRKSNTAQILAGYTTTILYKFNNDIAAKMGIKQQNVQLVTRNWYNPNITYYWYNISSFVAILAMLACLVVTSQSVSRERELGTFDQLLVSPLLSFEILIGKIIPGLIIGMAETVAMLAIGVFLLEVPFVGSVSLFLFSMFIFVFSVSGVGLFISSLSTTQQQALLGIFVFMLPSVLISGFATPIENMPHWLQPVTYAIPLRYMLVISKGLFLKDLSFRIVMENVWPMAFISLFTIAGAIICFRRRLE